MPRDPADLPLHAATIMAPPGISVEELGQAPHVRQVSVYARAASRSAFARKLIEVGIESRSPAAVAAWLRDYGYPSVGNETALAAVQDDRVYLAALNHYDVFLPYPPPV